MARTAVRATISIPWKNVPLVTHYIPPDKRIVLGNGIDTLSLGHFLLEE